MGKNKIQNKTEKSEQVRPAAFSENHDPDAKCCADKLKNEKNSCIKKWKQLAFDKQIELIFAFFVLVFTGVLAFTAKDQLGIIRDQIHIENRAWLCAAGISAKNGFKVGGSPTVIIKFSSSGNSPARDMTIKYNMKLRDSPLPDNIPMGEYLSEEPSRGVIAPTSEFSSPEYTKKEIVFTEEDVGKISRNESRLYVYGNIDYLDIFNERHCTYFCFVSRVEGPENKVGFQVCSNNNDMTDKECKYN
jgi:hypothetical protein